MSTVRNRRTQTAALAELAAHFGIEPGFRDARGEDVVTKPETQKRLLSAMGVEATNETDAMRALNSARNASAQSALPSVVVVRPDATGSCSVTVAKCSERSRIAWLVDLEGGTQRHGINELPRPRQAVAGGVRHEAPIDLGQIPCGYHQIHLPDFTASATLIVTPGKCWLPETYNEAKLWGIAAQLYLLRSDENWGIGDFADLRKLVELAAKRGCDVVGLNPLHQMFLDSAERASPYSPLSRLFLNVLYIAVPEVPGYSSSEVVRNLVESADFKARLSACRAAPDVDYSSVVELKLEALRILHAAFENSALEDLQSFESFQEEKGVSLRRTSIFQALRQHFGNEDPAQAEWHSWPDEYRDAASEAVQRFAEEHADEIDFFGWLQWVADEQLARAAKVAEKAGMTIGLYRDLAVGCDQSGAETWANPNAFMTGAQVGAPPDIFNPAGQDWGLPPFHPNALRDDSYRSFVELIRANMRHAGSLRIDHVMGLQHLYCIPKGCSAAEGAYVGYPLDDLIGILALESHRHRCLVIGEDLGTVPEGFREKMAAANILSYRVLFFEQDWDNGGFLSLEEYPRLALAVAGNHDLPTLIGWWEGRDIDLKERLGLYPTKDEARSQRERREQDCASILEAFRQEGVLKDGTEITAEQFTIAAHDFLARTGSGLVIPQLDDLLGEADQVNVPATSFENPNWRRKYRMTLEELASSQNAWFRVGRLPELRKSRGNHAA